METTSTREELDQLVRTLSHDMSANFMLLENSFSTLKKSLDRLPQECGRRGEVCGQIAHVEACLQQSKRFLDDLAWLGRTGGVEMEPDWVELAGVIEEVLFEQRELLQRRKIEVDIARSLPVVWCNKDRLKQIVTNLVRNAAHHGCNATRPIITIGPPVPNGHAVAGSGRVMAFRVHDNGPGIKRRFHRQVFLPGMRLKSVRKEGSGMGLAIVKKIVDHYGGSVYVDPNCQVGTAMVVSLPGPAGRIPAPPSATDTVPEPKGRSWKLQGDGGYIEQPQRQLHGALSS